MQPSYDVIGLSYDAKKLKRKMSQVVKITAVIWNLMKPLHPIIKTIQRTLNLYQSTAGDDKVK